MLATAGGRRRVRPGVGHVPGWMVLPALAMYLLFSLVPLFTGSWYAFTDWDGISADAEFVGLDNVRDVFEQDNLRRAVRNTVVVGVGFALLANGIGLLLALGLNRQIRSRNILRALFFAPAVVSPLAVAYVWRFILQNDGALNRLLDLLGLESWQRSWLGDPGLALWAILVTLVWQWAGLSMVVYLAGLQSIPAELNEASAVDGVGPLQRFRFITWPLLAPAVTVNVVLSLIFGLKLFDQTLALTGGGPGGTTENLATTVWRQAFVNGRFGSAAATALVLTALVIVVAVPLLLVLRRREEV